MRQGGERCGGSEAASRAAERREVRRTCGGAHRPPRGERGGAGKAAVGNGARAPSPPPVRTSHPRRASPSRPRRSSLSPSFTPPISPPPRLPLSPPLPPLPPRPYGRGGRKKAKSAAPLLAARRLPHDLWGRGGSLGTAGFLWARGLAQAAAGSHKAAKRDKKAPSFPHSGKNPPQNIAICAPVCYTMHATQFHR